MAVMMIMSWQGVSLEQYEDAKKVVRWEEDPAVGGILHATAHDGNGLRITDVWETPEAFQAFVDDRLMPAVQELGFPGQPDVEIYPLHDLWTPGV
jgi:hypothetical protein